MKTVFRLSLSLWAILIVLVLTGCTSIPNQGSSGLVIGSSYTLNSGETLPHDLLVIGGNAHVERDATVNGSIAVIGGTTTIDGTINGDVAVMGGSVRLDDHAVVHGSLAQLGGSIDRSERATVDGTEDAIPLPPKREPVMRTPPIQMNFDFIAKPMLAFFRALALAALAIFVQMFAARPIQRVAHAVRTQPLMTGAIGMLTLLVVPALLVIIAITIILLPVSLLGFLLAGVALVYGWLAVGLVTGQQMAHIFKQDWSEPISAAVGTLALSLLASIANLIFCIGWLPTFLISIVGLGAVVITRAGTQFYTVAPAPAPAAAYAPAPSRFASEEIPTAPPDTEIPLFDPSNEDLPPQN